MALEFDGSNDDVNFGDISELDTPSRLTLSFWYRPNSATRAANDGIVGKRSGSTGFLADVGGTVDVHRFLCPDTSNFATLSSAFTADTWAHWAWVYDGSGGTNADRLKLYKNGVAQSLSFTGTISTTNIVDSTTTAFLVGQEAGVNFAGMRFAHLRVWTAALSSTEVAAEYDEYFPQRSSDLLLWCPFDDGTTAADFSGNGHDGTVSGATQANGPLTVPFGASSGSYAITGATASLLADRYISTEAGIYTLTGASAGLSAVQRQPSVRLVAIWPAYDVRTKVYPI